MGGIVAADVLLQIASEAEEMERAGKTAEKSQGTPEAELPGLRDAAPVEEGPEEQNQEHIKKQDSTMKDVAGESMKVADFPPSVQQSADSIGLSNQSTPNPPPHTAPSSSLSGSKKSLRSSPDASHPHRVTMFPHIQALLAFDTPFYGIAPTAISGTVRSHYTTASAAFGTVSELAGVLWGARGHGRQHSQETSRTRFASASASASTNDNKHDKTASNGKQQDEEKDGDGDNKKENENPRSPPSLATSTSALASNSPTADAAATPSWQRWAKYAMFAGAAGAIAAGSAAALYTNHRQRRSESATERPALTVSGMMDGGVSDAKTPTNPEHDGCRQHQSNQEDEANERDADYSQPSNRPSWFRQSLSWARSHLAFVSSLGRPSELRARADAVGRVCTERGVACVVFYTVIGHCDNGDENGESFAAERGRSGNREQRGRGTSAIERTFCIVPAPATVDDEEREQANTDGAQGTSTSHIPPISTGIDAGPNTNPNPHPNSNSNTSTFRYQPDPHAPSASVTRPRRWPPPTPLSIRWRPAPNTRAADETQAHTSIFSSQGNDDFFALARRACVVVVSSALGQKGWICREWDNGERQQQQQQQEKQREEKKKRKKEKEKEKENGDDDAGLGLDLESDSDSDSDWDANIDPGPSAGTDHRAGMGLSMWMVEGDDTVLVDVD